jgi:hypothetical protein
MKTIKIKKSYDFSANSKIYLQIGSKKMHIKGFGLFPITIEPGEDIYASHLWTRSKKMSYDQLTDSNSLIIKPRMGKLFAFIVLLILIICFCVFIFTKYRWSFIPLAPIALYVLVYISILKNRYLIIASSNVE